MVAAERRREDWRRCRRTCRSVVVGTVIVAALLLHASVDAQIAPPPNRVPRGEDLTVYLQTVGPGNMVWEYYGHNTLILVDSAQSWRASYNYGIFEIADPFVFLSGRLIYALAPLAVDRELESYRQAGRRVWRQELRLTPQQRRSLFDYLHANFLNDPTYPYNYYRDNCSTRIRDALDHALGGEIRTHAAGAVETTFRWHSLRLSEPAWAQWIGIQLAQGLSTEEQITLWDEMFLPGIFKREVSRMTVPMPDGSRAPLVVAEEEIAPPSGLVELHEPSKPPMWVWWHLFAGILIGGAITEFRRSGRKKLFAATAGFWLLVNGIVGVLLVYLWWGSEHADSAANMNLFYYSPLGLVLLLLLVVGVWSTFARRAAFVVAHFVVALAAVGIVLEWFPALSQTNGSLIALALPIHGAIAIALREQRDERAAKNEGAQDPTGPGA